jgi:hypothetical protein
MSKATIYPGALEDFLPSNDSKRKGTLVLLLDDPVFFVFSMQSSTNVTVKHPGLEQTFGPARRRHLIFTTKHVLLLQSWGNATTYFEGNVEGVELAVRVQDHAHRVGCARWII